MKRRKVFIVYGQGSRIVRNALIRRGWIEKIPNNIKYRCDLEKGIEKSLLSNYLEEYNVNFIWGTKPTNKEHRVNSFQKNTISNTYKQPKKREFPMRNRLKVVNHWSTKHGICSTLKNSTWYYIDNVAEVIAPRTFSNVDNYEKREFINDYKFTSCTSLLRWFIESLQNNKPIFHESGTVSIDVILFAINRCKEFIYIKNHKDIDSAICNTCTDVHWNFFLKEYRSLISGTDLLHTDYRNKLELINCAKYVLYKIWKYRPQLNCEGIYNIWIVKPSGCSRGKGIEISSKLDCIMDIITNTNKKYVIQKYIGKKSLFDSFKFVNLCFLSQHFCYFSEKPLLIYNTKFDIRQYYLITSTYPLVIWMYTDCYLKFSSKKYTLNNLHKAVHLTNHAVQKHFRNSSKRHPKLPKNNMWSLHTYKCYLIKIGKQKVWDDVVYPTMRRIITGIMLSSQDSLVTSKNRFGLFGCDFILDNNYTPWLIEINNRPDMGPTTDVTANICPKVIADIIKGIVSKMIIIWIEFSIN